MRQGVEARAWQARVPVLRHCRWHFMECTPHRETRVTVAEAGGRKQKRKSGERRKSDRREGSRRIDERRKAGYGEIIPERRVLTRRTESRRTGPRRTRKRRGTKPAATA